MEEVRRQFRWVPWKLTRKIKILRVDKEKISRVKTRIYGIDMWVILIEM